MCLDEGVDKEDRLAAELLGAYRRHHPGDDQGWALVEQALVESRPALAARNVREAADVLRLLADDSADQELRLTACWLVQHCPLGGAVEPLAATLRSDPSHVVRGQAAAALGEYQRPSALASLTAAVLHDPDPDVRESAIHPLGQLRDPRVVPLLIRVLDDRRETAGVRSLAANVLATRSGGEAALPSLRAAALDRSAEVRYWAIYALGWVGDQEVLAELEAIAESDDILVPGWGTVGHCARHAIEQATARLSGATSCGGPLNDCTAENCHLLMPDTPAKCEA